MNATARQARILVIGHSCLDCVAVCDDAGPADGKLEARRIWTGAGGPAANAAIALRRLGHEVRLLTSIGDDTAGSFVRDTLAGEGVVLVAAPVESGTTSLAQIRAVGARRSVVWRRGNLPPLDPQDPGLESLVGDADLLYVDGHEVAAASRALRLARGAGRPTVADLGSLRPGAEDWPALLDSAVATPRWLAARFPGTSSLGTALEGLATLAGPGAMVGVSLGERGGFARREGTTVGWTARKTGVVDTTVAGDAFHAGLADALVQGMSVQAALDWAATLAAAVCRAPGHAALPADRAELALWHGRWGHRAALDPSALEEALVPVQGTATR